MFDYCFVVHAVVSKELFETRHHRHHSADGDRRGDVQSVKALKWLCHVEKESGIRLRTALSPEGEAFIVRAKVDGYDESTRTVYQFHGCYCHGCSTCFPSNHFCPSARGKRMEDLRETTRLRTQALREAGHEVVEVWEHEWDEAVKSHSEWTFPSSLEHRDPLIPRQALMGGRTNAVKLYYRCPPESKVQYVDFTSLYPSVQRDGGAYPLGHPAIVTEFEKVEDALRYFGLHKVKVLPPRNLYFPVLGTHWDGKLYFTLCRSCMVEQRTTTTRLALW